MSDGIDLFSPCCPNSLATNKEYELLEVRLRLSKKEDTWYNSHIPVYTCKICQRKWAIEGVYKNEMSNRKL